MSKAAIEEALSETLRALREMNLKLVSEVADVEEDLDEGPVSAEALVHGASRDLEELVVKLKELSYNPTVVENESRGPRVRFELPAGRSSRVVTVQAEDARSLVDELHLTSDWRSLQRYDGIWSASQGVIEVALRFDRFSGSLKHILQTLGQTEEGDPTGALLVESSEGVSMKIGDSSQLAHVLLAGNPNQRFATLRLDSVQVSTTEQADMIAEEVGDSFSFAARMNTRVGLQLRRLQSTRRRRMRLRTGSKAPTQFPSGKYPHAPVLMYHAGSDHLSAPPIRYWAFYQVLEYFFPRFTREEVLQKLAIHLRSPGFDPHNDEDIESALHISSLSEGHAVGEGEQLARTIRAIATADEIVKLITDLELQEHVADRKSDLTKRTIQLSDTSEILEQLAERTYDIRCRIVHSKDSNLGGNVDGPGIIPGTYQDDLVIAELPIIQFLAERAIVSSSQPLRVVGMGPRRRDDP